ncbi:MAG TPA: LamG-like jellyroll fold domain-containing protein [Bacteroidales bacterium]|nr:LamG-like jellyroll fold domain-containing protein [Bacteroidales bacterium]
MRSRFILLFVFLALGVQAQYYSLWLRGEECFYSDPGAGNGMRTMELWFKPMKSYDSSNEEFAALICREMGFGGQNIEEFYLAFQPVGLSNPGHLRFTYCESTTIYHHVFSDTNYWEIGVWHHAACVIHPDSGMMMFIDGKKQQSRNQFKEAAAGTSYNLAIGSWGQPPNGGDRYFRGMIDKVRISSVARYAKSFTPRPCIVPECDEFTIACWSVEEGSGNVLEDLSGNGHNGVIFGGLWFDEDPCTVVATGIEAPGFRDDPLHIYPNPADGILNIRLPGKGEACIFVYTAAGNLVYMEDIDMQSFMQYKIDVSGFNDGIYICSLTSGNLSRSAKFVIRH